MEIESPRRAVKQAADEMVYDRLYFAYAEFDDNDITDLATQCQVAVEDVCRYLKIAVPGSLK
jgi:hypothetical protein